ncbi:hypothetical protein ACFLUP_00415 [Chloroflexota bacterium]
MRKENCVLCGCNQSVIVQVKVYYIVPQAVTEQASIQRPKTVKLCSNCQQELGIWYSAKVGELTYDTTIKQFTPKSPAQLVKEYEIAYQWFTQYKKAQLTN